MVLDRRNLEDLTNHFNLGKWYQYQLFCRTQGDFANAEPKTWDPPLQDPWSCPVMPDNHLNLHKVNASLNYWQDTEIAGTVEENQDDVNTLGLHGIQIPRGSYPALQRNAAQVKNAKRLVPKPVVVTVKINGHPVRVLVDSRSLGDFMSSSLVDQIKVKHLPLEIPLGLQLAVQGSWSKINAGTKALFEYSEIKEDRYFNIINISSYDIILGTLWIFQHQACIGLNPSWIIVGCNESKPLEGTNITKLISRAVNITTYSIDEARQELVDYAAPMCRTASETELLPFCAINHTIPLIEEHKIYPWCPLQCLEAMCDQWIEKQDTYLKSGCWEITSSRNTVPMLMIPKPKAPGEVPVLQMVVDL